MPDYAGLRPDQAPFERTVERLMALRSQLDRDVPDKNLETSLLLATWNIRESDSAAYGERLDESIFYIAEIVSRFDLVAVQEVRQDLRALERLMRVLGRDWTYFVTDVTEGTRGNQERLAFLYDRRKVRFNNLASQLVLPPLAKKQGSKRVSTPATQIARTPFIIGFSAAWTKFVLATVHIIYGTDDPDAPERIEEIRQVASALRERGDDATRRFDNLVLLGDFNIYTSGDQTMKALTDQGWVIPDALQQIPGSNVPKDKRYDQIAFRPHPQWFEPTGRAGIFDYYQSVFRDQDEQTYIPDMGSAYNKTDKGKQRTVGAKKTYYRAYWRTFQMSDHLPMWLEIRTDYSSDYLDQRRKQAPA
jgi:endonuclease/exonuclease/phosphatase family metal-dependent hydrolase